MSTQTVPEIVFHTRVRNDALGGPNPFEWKDVSTAELFAGKNVVLFGVPGAFTPACSDTHLPGYERHHDDFRAAGIDAVYCLSVNDASVMFQWAPQPISGTPFRMRTMRSVRFSIALGSRRSRGRANPSRFAPT